MMTSFNVFKAVKLGEATNYRLTLKRVRRKARRRLTAIQQWYRPENWKHVIPWCCPTIKAKQLCESQSHGIDVTHPRLTSRLTQQPSSAVDAKSVTLTPPQHTTHSPFRSHSSPASALRSPRFRFLRHHRRDGWALPLLSHGGVLPRHPLGGVPGRGAPPDPLDARRAPGALLLRRARRAARRARGVPDRVHGRCVRFRCWVTLTRGLLSVMRPCPPVFM